MSREDVYALVAFGVGFFALIPLWRWISAAYWRSEVRSLMNASPGNQPEAERMLRTMLALDGQRMPKTVRDAVAQWLAEREAAS